MKKIIIKKKFAADYITREAGEKLRFKIADSLKNGKKTTLDFSGLMIASTSFFDEGIAKLVLDGFSPDTILKLVKIENIYPRDREVLAKMCQVRGWKFE